MGQNSDVIMWAAQMPVVLEKLERDGVSYVKREYIDKKYGEVAWVFKTAYDFFIQKFRKMVEKPEQAESPVWLYKDPKWAGANQGVVMMKLGIPKDQVVYFDTRKWSQILNLSYLGDETEKVDFEREMKGQGVNDVYDIFAKPYYPILKSKVIKSWDRLFDIEEVEECYLQGAVWYLKKEWIREVI